MRHAVLLFCLVAASGALASPSWAENRNDGSQPFAIVELFTSQGCSSCPPADAYVQDITALAREKNLRIFTVGFHVDYWDYLGWRDPFGSVKYSNRQRKYAQIMRANTIYTPQIIVNGQDGFGGFDRDKGGRALQKALSQKPLTDLSLTSARKDRGKLRVGYVAKGLSKNLILNIALVERDLQTDVSRGENAGRLLQHDNSVRGFKSIKLTTEEGSVPIDLPEKINLGKASVIGYLQDPRTMRVIGANILDLNLATP